MYAHARETAGEIQAQRALRDALTAEDAALGRLKFDARKWTASKLLPKKYGDKLELSGDPQSPLAINIVRFSDPPKP